MRATRWICRGAAALALGLGWAAALAADVLATTAPTDQYRWARWQGRLTLGTTAPAWRLGVESATFDLANSAALMGDYYFTRSLANTGRLGGFRATSGLVIGTRGAAIALRPGTSSGSAFSIGSRPLGQASLGLAADPALETTTVPYVGLGYTGLSLRSRLSFSADLGLTAQPAVSGLRLGRAGLGGSVLDEAVRDLRLAPLVQLGVSYSF